MEVSPKQLDFKSDFKSATTTYLTLSNTKSVPLAFKVKTNAAKVYSVKPNISVVPPNESVKVQVTLPTLRQSLPANYRSKHKFLVLSLPSDGVLDSSIQETWPELQKKYQDSLELTRIKVKYVDLNGASSEAAAGTSTSAVAAGSPVKLNGRSQRISKFVPNGTAANGAGAGAGAESVPAGAIAGGAAVGGAAAVAAASGASYGSRTPSSTNAVSATEEKQPVSRPYTYQAPSRQATSYGVEESSGSFAKELDNIHGQNERLGKKLDNIERLMIIALMLLSFILGKSMV